jgi:hypothetical protein
MSATTADENGAGRAGRPAVAHPCVDRKRQRLLEALGHTVDLKLAAPRTVFSGQDVEKPILITSWFESLTTSGT